MILKHKRPFKLLLGYLLIFTNLSSKIKMKANGYILYFFPTSLSLSYFLDPNERTSDEYYLSRILTKGDVLVDVGANIGTLTIYGSKIVEEQGLVYAIEAHPSTFEYLQANINLNNCQNVKEFNLAVGENEGEIYFTDKGADDQNHISIESKGILISLKRLDQIIPKISKIKMLKIDAEGFELPIIRGASQLLTNIEVIYYESDEKHCQRFNYSTSEIVNYLTDNNFNVCRIDDGNLISLPKGYISFKRDI
jgi:FkbM family methyltransferase